MTTTEISIQPRAAFDGATYVHERDGTRLMAQIARVWKCMRDQRWRDLKTIAIITGDPEASVSARLRDLRKDRFGKHTVERRYLQNGHFEYRLVPSASKLVELMSDTTNA